jgi:hypothetical protein
MWFDLLTNDKLVVEFVSCAIGQRDIRNMVKFCLQYHREAEVRELIQRYSQAWPDDAVTGEDLLESFKHE